MKVKFNDLKRLNAGFVDKFKILFDDHLESHDFINGRSVRLFEKQFGEKLKSNFVACSNGTDAISAALFSIDIKAGDEVILPAMSWVSTAEVISLVQAKPIFVDVDEHYTLDVEQIEQHITSKTKAVIPVHLYGNSCEMNKIMEVAGRHKLTVIEDCAQAHFTKYGDDYVGTIGDIGTFSFFPGKNLGSLGDAGGISTKDNKLYEILRRYVNHGSIEKHKHEILGTNARMDSIQASFLNTKLPHIDTWNNSRRDIASIYNSQIDNPKIISKPSDRDGCTHTYHVYCLQVENRKKFIDLMNLKGIQTAIHYPIALPFLQPFKNDNSSFPNAKEFQESIVSIPIFPGMSDNEINYVIDNINSY